MTQTVREQFEQWLEKCPVEYYEAFGKDTYMFLIRDDDNVSNLETSSIV